MKKIKKTEKANKKYKLFIILLMMIGMFFLCYPIIKNSITIITLKNTVITQAKTRPSSIQENETIEYPSIESYANASKKQIGESVGQLTIPSVNINTPMFEGLHNQEMLFGVGIMYPKRIFEKENVVILGHHLGISDVLLGKLKDTSIGDLIQIQFMGKKIDYVVNKKQIIKETEINVLKNTSKPQLTLITCDKPTATDKRILVTAIPIDYNKKTKKQSSKQFKEVLTSQEIIQRSIVKYCLLPIMFTFIIFMLCSYLIWQYL